jgi:hypothetical protein
MSKTREEKITEARKLFRDFHGYDAEPGDIKMVEFPGEHICLVIGEAYGIMYKTEETKEPYLHKFDEKDRPILVATSDGSQTFMLMGAYRFTDRGFMK